MKKIIKTIILLSVILTLVACGGNDKNKNKKLIVAQSASPRFLDPIKAIDTTTVRVYKQIYDQLVTIDKDMNIIPSLAESWEQKDNKTLVFNLRKGVKFHNGEEMKGTDVKFSIERMKDAPTVSFLVSEIDRVDVIDDYKVAIITKSPFGPLLSHLAHPGASILNEKAVKAGGENYQLNPIGTGPFIFDKWVAGEYVSVKANKEYYRGAPKLDEIIFKIITEGTNRAIGLETGELDLIYDVDPMDIKKISENSKLELKKADSLGTAYIVFNMNKEPLNKKEVRQAIAYALNIPEILKSVYLEEATKADSPMSNKVPGYASGRTYTRDTVKAKELLKEAGYPNGFKINIWINDMAIRRDTAIIAQAQLKEIGIDVTIETLEWGALLDRTAKGEHEIGIFGGWVTVTGDGDYGLYPLFHTSSFGRPGNRSFYSNKKVDADLDLARHSLNQNERIEAYARVQKQVQEDLPILTYAFINQNVGLNKRVQNFELAPTGYHDFYNVSLGGN